MPPVAPSAAASPSPSQPAAYTPPPGSQLHYTESYFTNARGKRMFSCALFPAVSDAHASLSSAVPSASSEPTTSATPPPAPQQQQQPLRGVVLFLHGVGEHALRFTHVFEHLCARGFGVLAYDLAAHGHSESERAGMRAHGEQFQHFVDDTNRFLRVAKREVLPPLLAPHGLAPDTVPLVFMGISFGTLVGLHTVLSGEHVFHALVLASPAISVEYTLTLRVMSLLSKPLSWLVPTARLVPGVNYEGLSRDAAFLEDYMSDPLNVTGNFSVRMGEQSAAAMELLARDPRVEQAESAFCALPLLIVQGSADKVTSVPMARAFFERIANRDKHFREFAGLFHCIFNEPEKQDVLDHITQWLSERIAGNVEAVGANNTGGGDPTDPVQPAQRVLHSKL